MSRMSPPAGPPPPPPTTTAPTIAVADAGSGGDREDLYMAPEHIDLRPSPIVELNEDDGSGEEAYMAPEHMVGLAGPRSTPPHAAIAAAEAESLYMNPEHVDLLGNTHKTSSATTQEEEMYSNPEQLFGKRGPSTGSRRSKDINNYSVEVWSSDEGDDSDDDGRPRSLFLEKLEESAAAADQSGGPQSSSESFYMAPETALASLHEEQPAEDTYMSPESLDLHGHVSEA